MVLSAIRAESFIRLENELRGKIIVPTIPLAMPFFVHIITLASISTANIGNPVASKPATIKFAEAKFDKYFDSFSARRKRLDNGLMMVGALTEEVDEGLSSSSSSSSLLLLLLLLLFSNLEASKAKDPSKI